MPKRKNDDQFRALVAEIEVASRARDEFLATLSHELRTPLNAIMGWTQTLQSNVVTHETMERGLMAIQQSAQKQANLIDDLLNASDLVCGRIHLDAKPVNLIPIANAAIHGITAAVKAKNLHLDFAFDLEPCIVYGDKQRLQQIIWNLLSNAAKFTKAQGTIRVTLDRCSSHVRIAIIDNGEGISPDFLPFVFDRFRQADSSSKRKSGGLGLGLAIVRYLVELHGGKISAESDGKEKGATFSIYFPICSLWKKVAPTESDQQAPMMPVQQSEKDRKILSGLRILSVDDDCNTREMLQEALEIAGAEVSSADSVRDALNKLQTFRPDVLLSDIGMPEEDGYDLLNHIRALPQDEGGNTPAIALTGYTHLRDRSLGHRDGYQAFMTKPVNLNELLSTIANVTAQATKSQH